MFAAAFADATLFAGVMPRKTSYNSGVITFGEKIHNLVSKSVSHNVVLRDCFKALHTTFIALIPAFSQREKEEESL